MPSIKLTQSYIDNLPTPDKSYWILDIGVKGLRLYVARTGGKTYYLKYKNAEGKSDTFKIGDEKLFTPISAREAAKKFLAEMIVNGTDIKKERSTDDVMTVEKISVEYLAAGKSQFTVDMLGCFAHIKDIDVRLIIKLDIQKWRVKYKEASGNCNKTINTKVTALATILNFGVNNKLILENPIRGLEKLPLTDSVSKVRYLEADENDRLLDALEEMDREAREARGRSRQHAARQNLPDMAGWTYANYFKPLVLVALNTGIRKTALLSLRWDDVDLAHGNIKLRAKTAKSKKEAIIPINKTALTALTAWHKQRDRRNPLVWPSPQTGRIMNNCDSSFTALLKKAEITNFVWHDMRHNFASQLVMKGIDLNTVRELMTHSDIKTTLIYAHLAPSSKRSAVEVLD